MKRVGIHKKLFGLFLVTVTVLTIMGVFVHLSLQDRDADRWVTHTYEVQTALEKTLLDIESAQDEHESYRLKQNSEGLLALQASLQKTSIDLEALRQLVTDNPEQGIHLLSLQHSIEAYRTVLETPLRSSVLPSGTLAMVQEFILLEKVHRSADSMMQAEQDLLEQRTRANRVSQRRVDIALVCFLVMVSLMLVALFHAVRQDIAREQAGALLRHASDQKIAKVLENMSDGFYAVNHDWVVTYMNVQAEHLLHRSREETVGRHLWEIYADAVDTEFGDQYRRAVREQVTVRFEAYYPTHAAWYDITAYPNEDGLAIFFANVNERRRAKEELERENRQEMLHAAAQRRNQELQDLARRLVEMQEAERGRLAYELHEEIGQTLAGLKLSLASIMKQQEELREPQLQRAERLVSELIRHVRALSVDLRPGVLDDLGLVPALEWYCKSYSEQSEIAIEFEAIGLESRLDGAVETTAYRIVQEALACTTHQSGVTQAAVRLSLEDDYLVVMFTGCRVCDAMQNGEGCCDPAALTGIRERATLIGGSFEVESCGDSATTLIARLPVHPIYTSLES